MRWRRPERLEAIRRTYHERKKNATTSRRLNLRESAVQRGYDKFWARESHMRRMRHGICECCEMLGIITPICGRYAGVVDHVIPIAGASDPLRFEDWNLWVLCTSCHNFKRLRLDDAVRAMPRNEETVAIAKRMLAEIVANRR